MLVRCPLCDFNVEITKTSKSFNIHLKEVHNISSKESYEAFLREVYYPLYFPDKNRVCKICGNLTKFFSFIYGFKETCCSTCTSLLKYGTTNPNKSIVVKQKKKETSKRNYGVDNPSKSSVVKEKKKQTSLKRYGVDNPQKSKEVREKVKFSNLEKYGVENPSQVIEFKEKRKQTLLKRYNKNNPSQVIEFKEKRKQTLLNNYGVEHNFKIKRVSEKIKEDFLEKYGTSCILKSPKIRKKITETNFERYGSPSPFGNQSIIEKSKQTLLNNYGVEHPLHSYEIRKISYEKRRSNYYNKFIPLLEKERKLKLLSPKEDYISFSKPDLEYKCLKCGTNFFSSNIGQLDYIVCSNCVKVSKSSYEYEISEFLKSQGISNIINNSRSIISPKEIDIYIPDHKLGIELDGLYWHTFKKHDYHLKKTEAAESLGIQLLHITDSEWINKQDIVKSIILSKLGIYKERIFARKCKIKEVENKEYKEFLENNHIQGYTPTKIRLGLYLDNKLLSIAGFSSSRFKLNEIELVRQCSLQGYQVVGGVSKLIKHYVAHYLGKNSLITYCDRRYSNGKGYELIGFYKVWNCHINYWYFSLKSYYLQNRMNFQKKYLKNKLSFYDESLTEKSNMELNGYFRYYDCGNIKFEYKTT